MPTYEYECKKGHRFERLQAITAGPLRKCVECGSSAKRLISSGTGLIFKGSGFYITDYKRKGFGSPEAKLEAKSKANSSGGDAKPCPTPKECGRDTCASPKPSGD
jgi:putative FmdB family regulatory protein